MTAEEVSRKYSIPIKILKEYESWGLCGEVKKIMAEWHYDDTDIQQLSLIMTLHDIGFSNDDVEVYMKLLLEEECEEKCIKMLNKKRSSTLDEIHFKEKQLERMDYLRYEMGKEKK